tara:strand:+ start:408 stop:569 length:162 start_codon:yes stop_codon:yes gene_type:complete
MWFDRFWPSACVRRARRAARLRMPHVEARTTMNPLTPQAAVLRGATEQDYTEL